MFRLLLTSALFFVFGYYTRDYDLLARFSPKALEPIVEPIQYNQKTSRFGKVCSIVRPAGYEEHLIKVSQDLQISDDFTTKQLSIEDKTSNSTDIYCYLSVDTEEYKLTLAVRYNTTNVCYKEVYKFEARDSFKYETINQNYQIQRICCSHEESNGYATCRMTNWLSEQTEYAKQIKKTADRSNEIRNLALFIGALLAGFLVVGIILVIPINN